ncbi:UDP-glucose 4-epimerase [Clostridium acetobutylicum]|uniref:Nucleoside-diphosphate-sugar epimerase (UDP-glucose 4-epimerase) n=1 Tax=Clostridium acetobutylicum (strain ATCC 824 / DSM 792 / JCM 1419 / IAM 19013 / LMG 5710 / NBRC 13948 / NRRL B-527 / VKM B-1787 / 2291 / W) TaxID=272562 RepID=Q97KX2_CLOAB|nr:MULTISPECIES: NAD-dependent epimerase/dehydratase family protein [Clostridium]AAK78770.1 Nucleoside-diphosphate-sugar epimerase (UDP-glucose 4-epimerase) [Clostridium acetobutylicum ATCC 824]ADZ19844.1 Nucleoside-diphosphate-sugar epimerase (UDP-glucose 4-epimerase) [Clostridium acetobutylicum EA 2018]AEI33047.1 nucleoside-diphosphate-sugar epimerase (UDP-glucose 4-epimerase) [Clostridium acetobutylicum DSM 1731]AWV80488.1 nucleoside-diphosphate sugar epimerase [Clostridium acetobutylicum]M
MHYLITGGAGFIGTNLTLRLLNAGHKVTVLDNFSATLPDRLNNTKATVIKGSVLDRNLVFSLVNKCDYIIHLAAVVGVRLAMLKGIEGLKVSCTGTDNMLEAAHLYNKGIFISSSSAIYGKISKKSVDEEDDSVLGTSKKPSWLYSVGKLTEEHLVLAYHRELGVKVKIGRFFNVIGPYQVGNYGMVVPTFINVALEEKPIQVYGNGQQTRTFGYIEDILNGLQLVLNYGEIGEIYNIGGTEEIRILDLAKKIKVLTQSNSNINLVPYEKAFDKNFEETLQRVPDISKLKKLGYTPHYSLDEALKSIIKYEVSKK